MSNKTKAVFIVIVGLILVAIGVLASLYLIQRLQASKQAQEQTTETVKTTVVVVTRDMSLGDEIAATDVQLASVPVEFAPRDVIATVEETVGRIIKADLVQGEMVLQHNLADPTNKNSDLSFILAEDHVLLAFPADDLMSRENMVQRGDIIDILATFKQKVKTVPDAQAGTTAEQNEPQTRTFTVDAFQKVSVTALVLDIITEDNNDAPLQSGNNAEPANVQTRISSYLLALNPQDALVLKHLKDTDAIFDIVLRAPTSTAQFDLTPVTEEYIIEFYGLEILP